jgi:hypothetical protein
MSSDYAAVEVVQGITGSMAVILAVPVTAGLCALIGSKVVHVRLSAALLRTRGSGTGAREVRSGAAD